jgi:predicted secreted protein
VRIEDIGGEKFEEVVGGFLPAAPERPRAARRHICTTVRSSQLIRIRQSRQTFGKSALIWWMAPDVLTVPHEDRRKRCYAPFP